MAFIEALLTGAATIGAASGLSRPTENKDLLGDNYKYQFRDASEFENTNGDEFEFLDSSREGLRSKIVVYDADRNSTVIKKANQPTTTKPKSETKNSGSGVKLAAVRDSFEDNDSFEKATSAFEVGTYENGFNEMDCWIEGTISQKTSGMWWWQTTYIDKDFYSFDCCVTGELTVELSNIPSNCDYDLRAYRLEDGPRARASSLNFDNYIARSTNAAGMNERITLNCTPGCYYFCVHSYNDKTYDNDHLYHLSFNQKEDENREDVEYWINEGKAAGDKGAIWVSNYQPLGITPVTLTDSNSKYTIQNYDQYPYIRHLADKYINGKYINYAVLYVWDLGLRAYLSALAGRFIDALNAETDWNDEYAKNVNIGFGTAGFVLSASGAVLAVVSAAELAALASAAVLGLGIFIGIAGALISLVALLMAFNTNAPFLAKKKDLLAYLVSMQQTFAVGNGSNENEVKILRYRYRFENSGNNHILDWSPFYLSSDYNFYNAININCTIANSGITGTIHGFKERSDIEPFLQ